MKFFTNRRSTRYHAALDALTKDGAVRPVPAAEQLAEADTSRFPYAETSQLTKTFLGRYVSQEVTDTRLLELIADHGCKEAAFAACAMFLSIKTVRTFLERQFAEGADRTEVLEPYLQCFVAAAFLKTTSFAVKDRTFATVLLSVTGDETAEKAATLYALLSAWRAGPPEDAVLKERALSLSATVLHNASRRLEGMMWKKAWCEAAEYRRPLLQLEEVFKTAGKEFEGCVGAFLKKWRGWVAWEWQREHGASQRRIEGKFEWLWELWGPDLDAGGVMDEAMGCLWKGMVRREGLPEWLKKKKRIEIRPGIGRNSSSQSSLTETMEGLERAIDVALGDGEASLRLLEVYVERSGLDVWSVETWKSARRLLVQPLPLFVDYLVVSKGSLDHADDLDTPVLIALDTLKGDEYSNVRTPIVSEIVRCVNSACNNVEGKLRSGLVRLDADFDWLFPALRLWRLHEAVGKASWLVGDVDPKIRKTGKSQPPLEYLQILQQLHKWVKGFGKTALLDTLEKYIRGYVLQSVPEEQQLARALHLEWVFSGQLSMKDAAVALAMLDTVDVDIRCSCIQALKTATGSKASELRDRLWGIRGIGASKHKGKAAALYINLTEAITSLTGILPVQPCWAALLWALFKADGLFIDEREFTGLGFTAYRRWIKQLHHLFGDKLELLGDVHGWLVALEEMHVDSVLEAIEKMGDGKPIVHRLLTTTKRELAKWHLKILQRMRDEQDLDADEDRFQFMLELLSHLDDSNGRKIYQEIAAVNDLDENAFQRVSEFRALAQKDRGLALARLQIWSNMSEVSPPTKAALFQISEALGLKVDQPAWSAAMKHFDDRVKELITRAKALERSRMALSRSRPAEAEELVGDLGLEVPDGMPALLADLPPELADVVQDVAEDQLELHFGLSHLHSLTKLALGVQGTETVIVTLQIGGGGAVDAFAVQLEEMASMPASAQDWIPVSAKQAVLTLPTARSGRRPTRLAHVVARTVRSELIAGEYDIETLYTRVKRTIQDGATECMVCAKDIGARLHRATCCGSMLCNLTASAADFATQTEMLRLDTRVMDLLLTAVYAVAKNNNLDLLPGRPAALSYPTTLLGLLNALPSTKTLAKAADMQASLRPAGKHAELLMSWLCNASRNYIISATGTWKIPNMPGIHQFLVVDNPPQIEAAFAKHNHLQPRMVLFHGTSMDRLYAILTQGLKVLSNTPLMKHGAVSGPGIYFSTDTALPISYAAGAVKAAGQPAFFKFRKDFDGPQVLLGCEHAGPASRNGAYVVTEPSKVIVRYIFLVPSGVAVPLAKDIVSPMISTFYSLRASAAVNR